MKKPYLLLIFTLAVVFLVKAKSSTGKQPLINPNLKGYVLTIDTKAVLKLHDTIIHKKTYSFFRISVKLTNNTKSPLNYITMTCGWDELFHLSNKHFEILGWGCDKNIPYVETLLPYKSSTFLLPIIKRKNLVGTEKLKIGMNLFIDNKQNADLFPLPVEKMGNVVWSNEIEIP